MELVGMRQNKKKPPLAVATMNGENEEEKFKELTP
jgi:hypothetical protein